MASHQVHLPVGDKRVEDLLLWRDPKKSGAVVGGVSVAYYLLEHSRYSLVSISANLLLLVVSATFLWANIASFANKPGPPVPGLLKEGVTEGQVRQWANQVTPTINKALAIGHRIATGKDVLLSFQVFVALYILAKVGSWCTVLGAIYFLVLVAFTVPKVYELKKPEIDSALNKVHTELKKLYDQHLAKWVDKIPKAKSAPSDNLGAKAAEFKDEVLAGSEPKKAL